MLTNARIYKARYLVTDDGRVFSMNYRKRQGIAELHQSVGNNVRCGGYFRVNVDGCPTYVHRIVAECFVPRPPGATEVNHKDGNKLNNRASNLEWVTHLENVRHAYRTGLITGAQIVRNARHPHPTRRTILAETARRIKELICTGQSTAMIAELLGVNPGVVEFIRRDATYKDVPWPPGNRRCPKGKAEIRREVREYRKRHKKENQCKS